MSDGDSYSRSDETMSLEGTLVKHFFMGLDRLQSTWMGEKFDRNKYNMQLLYLIRLLPDRKKQAAILKQWGEAQEETKQIPGLDPDEVIVYVGMEIVTEIVLFVCDAFELINTDIVGPATSKQYQRATIEIPDMEQNELVVKPVGS